DVRCGGVKNLLSLLHILECSASDVQGSLGLIVAPEDARHIAQIVDLKLLEDRASVRGGRGCLLARGSGGLRRARGRDWAALDHRERVFHFAVVRIHHKQAAGSRSGVRSHLNARRELGGFLHGGLKNAYARIRETHLRSGREILSLNSETDQTARRYAGRLDRGDLRTAG